MPALAPSKPVRAALSSLRSAISPAPRSPFPAPFAALPSSAFSLTSAATPLLSASAAVRTSLSTRPAALELKLYPGGVVVAEAAGGERAVVVVDGGVEVVGRDVRGGGVVMVFESEKVAKEWGKGVAAEQEVSIDDFEVMEPIGKGGFASVFLVRHRGTGEFLAMKVVVKPNPEASAAAWKLAASERRVLELAHGSPFLLHLRYAWQTAEKFYYVTDFKAGGTLLKTVADLKAARQKEMAAGDNAFRPVVPVDRIRAITSELILGLDFLHARNIVYRDLKPENVLFDAAGRASIADFGLAKILPSSRGRTTSFSGTRPYMAPETALKYDYGLAADMWSLGAVIYVMVYGSTPVRREHVGKGYFRGIVAFPMKERLPKALVELMQGLLCVDELERLTAHEAKSAAFFAGVNWQELESSSASSFSPTSSAPSPSNSAPEKTHRRAPSSFDLSLDSSELSAPTPSRTPSPEEIQASLAANFNTAELAGFQHEKKKAALCTPRAAPVVVRSKTPRGAMARVAGMGKEKGGARMAAGDVKYMVGFSYSG